MNQGSGLAGKEPRSREISPTPHAAPWPGDTSSLNPVQGHIFLAPLAGLHQGRTRPLLKLRSDKQFWLSSASGKITLNNNNWVLLEKVNRASLQPSSVASQQSCSLSSPLCLSPGLISQHKNTSCHRGKGTGQGQFAQQTPGPEGRTHKLLPAHFPPVWTRSAHNIPYLLVLPDGSEAGGFHVVAPAAQPVVALCRKTRKVHDLAPCRPQHPLNPTAPRFLGLGEVCQG